MVCTLCTGIEAGSPEATLGTPKDRAHPLVAPADPGLTVTLGWTPQGGVDCAGTPEEASVLTLGTRPLSCELRGGCRRWRREEKPGEAPGLSVGALGVPEPDGEVPGPGGEAGMEAGVGEGGAREGFLDCEGDLRAPAGILWSASLVPAERGRGTSAAYGRWPCCALCGVGPVVAGRPLGVGAVPPNKRDL